MRPAAARCRHVLAEAEDGRPRRVHFVPVFIAGGAHPVGRPPDGREAAAPARAVDAE